MGFFDFFKAKRIKENGLKKGDDVISKSEKINENSMIDSECHKPSNWTSNYIYGFINGNPMQKFPIIMI